MGSSVTPELPASYRSAPVLRTASILSAVLLAGMVLFWSALDPATKATFTALQAWTLVGIIAVIIVVMMALGLSSVRVSADGMVVRNGFVRHRLDWDSIAGVSYGDGDPWPYLELTPDDEHPEGRTLMMLGIQRIQGDHADDQVAQLRSLIAAHART